MQTKYYLTFEQVGVIRRIPIKEQDPDMQGILDAFTEAFRIANEMSDDDKVNTIDLINALQHCDTIYIDTVEIYEEGFEMIEQKVPLGDAGQCVRTLIQICVRTLIQIINYEEASDISADNLARELRTSMKFHWRQLNPGNSEPDPAFVKQFTEEVIDKLRRKL